MGTARRALLALASAVIPGVAPASPPGEGVFDDVLETFALTGRAAIAEFTEPEPLAALAVGSLAVLWMATEDTALQRAIEDGHWIGDGGESAADYVGLGLSVPLVSFGAYAYGRLADDARAMRFAMELQATMLLAQVETSLISQLDLHQRPTVERGDETEEQLSFFDAAFRGRSSFPSGHMIGPFALTLHGFDTYGWAVGLPAAGVTAFVAVGRVQEGRHFPTDIVGALGLTTAAFLAARAARRWLPEADGGLGLAPLPIASQGGLSLFGAF